jgi:RNA polymerase sigma-70 factor (ECF subfamily)
MWKRPAPSAPGAGDRLVALYRQYGAMVYARCRQILDDASAAEDATQETFLRAKRHLDRHGEPESVIAWLYTVATNHCLNERRNGQHRPLLVDPGERALEGAAETLANRDLAARLITRCHPRVQAAAWLVHVDGMTQDEAARMLGISRRTVVQRLSRLAREARRFLQRSEV